eukprot:TRINITY_DN50934_c0_g1_i1.p1 TRINITY_DN50934_c0_g1~~TRINITY_DN50934_c0_g1_i1.p1  ORF type:complete len:475 (-),score=48.59 TRINITY_DN50934_c0_g1_i1:287-1711(-)
MRAEQRLQVVLLAGYRFVWTAGKAPHSQCSAADWQEDYAPALLQHTLQGGRPVAPVEALPLFDAHIVSTQRGPAQTSELYYSQQALGTAEALDLQLHLSSLPGGVGFAADPQTRSQADELLQLARDGLPEVQPLPQPFLDTGLQRTSIPSNFIMDNGQSAHRQLEQSYEDLVGSWPPARQESDARLAAPGTGGSVWRPQGLSGAANTAQELQAAAQDGVARQLEEAARATYVSSFASGGGLSKEDGMHSSVGALLDDFTGVAILAREQMIGAGTLPGNQYQSVLPRGAVLLSDRPVQTAVNESIREVGGDVAEAASSAAGHIDTIGGHFARAGDGLSSVAGHVASAAGDTPIGSWRLQPHHRDGIFYGVCVLFALVSLVCMLQLFAGCLQDAGLIKSYTEEPYPTDELHEVWISCARPSGSQEMLTEQADDSQERMRSEATAAAYEARVRAYRHFEGIGVNAEYRQDSDSHSDY